MVLSMETVTSKQENSLATNQQYFPKFGKMILSELQQQIIGEAEKITPGMAGHHLQRKDKKLHKF